MANVSFDFNLEPTEAIEYLKNKGFKLSFNYDEIQKQAHHKAFTVAKVTRADLLNDIHEELLKSMKAGTGFKQFQKNIKPTLQKKGWWGQKDIVNPKTGEVKTINIGSRRLKTIYDTNMRVAYTQARYQQQSKDPINVYLRYVSELKSTTRDSHAAMHGIIKHRDDPWWDINHPLNGWNCKCKTVAISKRIIEKRGYKVDTNDSLENIASKDWDYNIGKSGSKIAKLSKVDLDKSLDTLPKVVKNKSYENLTNSALLATFYKNLGVKKGDIFIDKINDPMLINDSLFLDKKSKELKIKKQDRHLLLDYFSDTISDPDEIYLQYDRYGLKKNMFKYFIVDGKKEAIMVVFRYFKDKTQGATIFHVTRELEQRREMKLIYKKEESD